jgi:nucleoside-diphosphate-sugar epimerase
LIAGCGYVGSALAERLADGGHEVHVLRRSDRALPGTQLVQADLREPESLKALPAVETVVYTAAPDGGSEDAYRAVYVDGLRNLVLALTARDRAPSRLLLTTSTAVYAQDAGEWVDELSLTAPAGYQGRILLESEASAHGSGMRAVAVRFGGIYGPGRTRLIDEVRRGAATIPDRPSYTNRIHRDDCAGVLAHLMNVPEPEPVYVGVDDDPADRRLVIAWLAEKLGAPAARIEPIDGASERGKRCRNDRLRASGYRMRYRSFRDGYAEMLAGRAG